MAQQTEYILIDTQVFLDDPDIVARIRERDATPFLLGTPRGTLEPAALPQSLGQNAQAILRTLGKRTPQPLGRLPDARALCPGDALHSLEFRGETLLLLGRPDSETASVPALLALARDYGMILISRDLQTARQAEGAGIKVAFWKGPPRQRDEPEPGRLQPFALPTRPITEPDEALSFFFIDSWYN